MTSYVLKTDACFKSGSKKLENDNPASLISVAHPVVYEQCVNKSS